MFHDISDNCQPQSPNFLIGKLPNIVVLATGLEPVWISPRDFRTTISFDTQYNKYISLWSGINLRLF
jgi:hypothetical protein